MNENLIIRVNKQIYSNSIDIYLANELFGGKHSVGKSILFETIEQGCYTSPTLSIDYKTAQKLMDELWNCGIKPSEGTGSAGSLAATERHLTDMREIVFNRLRIKDKG